MGDIGLGLRIRGDPAEKSGLRDPVAENAVGAHDFEAFGLKLALDRRQQAVIAKRTQADTRKHFRRTPIRSQAGQAGAAHTAGHHDLGDTIVSQMPDRRGCGTHPEPDVIDTDKSLRIGFILDGQHKYGPARFPASFDDIQRERAIARDNAEFGQGFRPLRHLPLPADRSPGSNRRE